MISIFGKDFPDTVINIEGNSFPEYLKYEVFSFFGKDFPNIIEIKEIKGMAFRSKRGGGPFLCRKQRKTQKILKKEKRKKDNFSAKKTDRQTYP